MSQNAVPVQVAKPKLPIKGTFQNILASETSLCMQFVNIHSHKANDSNSLEIISLVAGRDSLANLRPDRLYSIGIHPWHTENLEKLKEILLQYASYSNIIAIGECGFDSKSSLPFSEQESLFVNHVKLSEKLEKPLIIHSVKMINELIRLKRDLKPQMPWIIHGFNANAQTANECVKHGLFMSVGHLLCNGEASITKVINQIPLTCLFFETDESDYAIEKIYQQYSLLTGKPMNDVTDSIYANFARYFLKDGNK